MKHQMPGGNGAAGKTTPHERPPATEATIFPLFHEILIRHPGLGSDLFLGAHDGILVLDRHARILDSNPAAERLFGARHEQLLGRDATELLACPELSNGIRDYIARQDGNQEAGAPGNRMACCGRRLDGTAFAVELVVTSSLRTDPPTYLAHIRDASELRRAEEAARETEQWFHLTFDAAPIGLAICSLDGRFLRVNDAMCRLTGYTQDDLLGRPFHDVTHPDDLEDDVAHVQRLLAGNAVSYEMEKRYLRKDGTVAWGFLTGSLVRDLTDRPLYFIAHVQDVTGRKRTVEEALRLAAIVESSSDAIMGIDMAGRVTSWNAAARKLYGYEPEEIIGQPVVRLIPPENQEVYRRISTAVIGGNRVEHYETVRVRKDGTRFHVSSTISPIHNAAGEVVGISAIVREITERIEAEELVRRYRRLSECTTDILFFFRPDGRITEANEAAARAYGYTRDELLAMNVLELRAPDAGRRLLFDTAQEHPVTYETINQRRNGETFPLEVTLYRIDDLGEPLFVGVARDISERKTYEEELAHQAFHDRLTGLPNRALFMDRLDHALARSARRKDRVAVLFLDLDRFKLVNDSKGHMAGDQLIIAVAHRLRGCLRAGDTIARFGGDEFTILLENVSDEGTATRFAERLLRKLQLPFTVLDQEVFTTASIGIAVSATPEATAEELLRSADLAMYEAKAAGKARYAVYQPHLGSEAEEQLRFETELRRAIARREFEIHYQPIILMETGRTIGVEALARWRHPRFGLMPPDAFVPLQEQIGLIEPFTLWVLREAMTECLRWHAAGHRITVSVNLSAHNLHTAQFANKVAQLLDVTGLPPSCLKLEITESAVMMDPAQALVVLQHLSDMGVRLSIDDFGTGYSSLVYLKQLPVHEIKIDKSFVIGMDEKDEDDAAIVRATIDLAHNLRKKVVAEGVETRDVWNLLNLLGCDAAQGFHMARPMPGDDVLLWLHSSEWGVAALQGGKGGRTPRRIPSPMPFREVLE